MTKIKLGVVALCALVSTAAADPNTADLAERVVGKTANVKEGEIVQISGGPQDIAFLEDLAVAVRKRGAFPIITFWSESAEKKLIAVLPEKYDGQLQANEMALAKIINVRIVLPAVRDASIFEKMPAARRYKIGAANASIYDTVLKRNVRTVELDNQLAPSPSRAKAAGLTEAEMASTYWAGLGADYGAIETKAAALKELLAKGTEVRITHPNGTDIKFKVKGRKVLTSDGVISDADAKAGGPAATVWLPAGEVFLAPVPGSAEGKIVDDRMVFSDKEVTGITAEFKAGKMTNITAKAGWDAVKPLYDAAGPGKNQLGVFDLGLNPAVKATPKFETFVAAGLVSLGTGENRWAGGNVKEPFGMTFQLSGATVTLDGKPLVENGSLK